METLLVGLLVLVGSAATGLFVAVVWRHLFRPATTDQPRRRRATIAACCVMPAIAAPILALLDLTAGEAFVAILAITCASLGLGIWSMGSGDLARGRRARLEGRLQPVDATAHGVWRVHAQ
jgi:hypothetical protein